MRKGLLQFAFVGAIALVGSVCFSACSDDVLEPEKATPVDNNGKTSVVDNSKELVPVDLGLSLSTSTGADTRMTAANVQAKIDETHPFRGINLVKIFSFQLAKIGNWVTNPGTSDGQEKTTQVLTFDGTTVSKGSVSLSSPPRVLEVTLPNLTNAVMFYGKAIRESVAASEDNTIDEEQGKINYNVADDVVNSTFSYVKRLSDAEKTNFENAERFLAGILTGIITTGLSTEPNPEHLTDTSKPATLDRSYWFWFCPDDNCPANDKVKNTADNLKTNTAGTAESPVWVQDKDMYRATKYDGTYEYPASATTPEQKAAVPITKTFGSHNYTLYHIDITWFDYTKATQSSLVGLEKNLSIALNALITIQGGGEEFRAGSYNAILRTIEDLRLVCNKAIAANPTDYKEAAAQELARRIVDERIGSYFAVDTNGKLYLKNNVGSEAATQHFDIAKSTMEDYNNAQPGATQWDFTSLTYNHVVKFPDFFHVPVGGTLLTYTDGGTSESPTIGTFSFRTTLPSYDVGGDALTVENYVYPAELMYFGNSPIKVSDNSTVQWPTSDKWLSTSEDDWKTADNWKSGANGFVTSSTRNVAMAQHINYGTAMLRSSVYVAAGTSGKIKDNSEPAKEITVAENMFKLKGVIIAQQPQKVGWDFLPTSVTGTNSRTCLIYDNQVSSTSIPTTKPAINSIADDAWNNYTLLLDNYQTGDTQQPVYVLLELENNTGQDLKGNFNMIRNGGTFYLIGQLNPTAASGVTAATQRNDGYALPPYKIEETITKMDWKPRVFMQDYVTSAVFKIHENSLKAAYVTMPDLQAEQVSLGLSVDVKWETGLTFEDIPVGGNEN